MAEHFLLDTCTLFWLATNSEKVPASTRDRLADENARLSMSIVSVWELALKESMGSLRIKHSLESFITSIQKAYHLELMPIQIEACDQLKKLPTHHRDPFDRMLICQSIVSGAMLVTPDKDISTYPIRIVW